VPRFLANTDVDYLQVEGLLLTWRLTSKMCISTSGITALHMTQDLGISAQELVCYS